MLKNMRYRMPLFLIMCSTLGWLLSLTLLFPEQATAQPDDGTPPPYTISQNIPPGTILVEGDILLPARGGERSTTDANLWPGGIVPYVFDPGVASVNQGRMRAAMDEWELYANVHFVPRTNEVDYLYVQNSSGNSSYVGPIGGAQPVNLFNWTYQYIIEHELAHALGVWHEQSRPDRDGYVQINTANITPGLAYNFSIVNGAGMYGSYDFDSVMHYDQWAFSVCHPYYVPSCGPVALRTITVKSPYDVTWQNLIGQRTHLSRNDKLGMGKLYPFPLSIVSVGSDGGQGNVDDEGQYAVSADGRYLAFTSLAANLVTNDTNGVTDVFVRDRVTGITTRVSVGAGAVQADFASQSPSISADGRYVAFQSQATNLVANDTNGARDIFVYDRTNGAVVRASVTSAGGQVGTCSSGCQDSTDPVISGDGRYVVFTSNAAELVSGGQTQVFRRDLVTNQTVLVSAANGGGEGNGDSSNPSVSTDGRYVAFVSTASTLVADDTNGVTDIFVRDMDTNQTLLVSDAPGATLSNGEARQPGISGNGNRVAFISDANTLVADDTNNAADVFVYDIGTEQLQHISVGEDEVQANGRSYSFLGDSTSNLTMNADGRYVAFSSEATNLVSGDSNICGGLTTPGQCPDVFLRDIDNAVTARVSITYKGGQLAAESSAPVLTANGDYTVFRSCDPNVVNGDTNDKCDAFIAANATFFLPKPTLLTPNDGTQTAETQPRLSWNPVVSATGYEVQIGLTNPPTTAVFQVNSSSTRPPAPLLPGFVYYWRARAVGILGNFSGWSDVRSFTVISENNVSPIRNYFTSNPINLSWGRVSWATSYEIEVSLSTGFGSTAYKEVFNGEVLSAAPTLPNGTYYWHVRALSATRTGQWSATDSFVVNVPG